MVDLVKGLCEVQCLNGQVEDVRQGEVREASDDLGRLVAVRIVESEGEDGIEQRKTLYCRVADVDEHSGITLLAEVNGEAMLVTGAEWLFEETDSPERGRRYPSYHRGGGAILIRTRRCDEVDASQAGQVAWTVEVTGGEMMHTNGATTDARVYSGETITWQQNAEPWRYERSPIFQTRIASAKWDALEQAAELYARTVSLAMCSFLDHIAQDSIASVLDYEVF